MPTLLAKGIDTEIFLHRPGLICGGRLLTLESHRKEGVITSYTCNKGIPFERITQYAGVVECDTLRVGSSEIILDRVSGKRDDWYLSCGNDRYQVAELFAPFWLRGDENVSGYIDTTVFKNGGVRLVIKKGQVRFDHETRGRVYNNKNYERTVEISDAQVKELVEAYPSLLDFGNMMEFTVYQNYEGEFEFVLFKNDEDFTNTITLIVKLA